jgi:hypothetical protein
VDDEKLQISKIEAARRQLDCAIELWFLDKDEVSIHTLAAAAYQIVHDIKAKRAEIRDLLYDSDMIKDEYRKQWINVLKRPQNFFKHADSDPDGFLEFHPQNNIGFIMFAAGGLRLLGEQTSLAVNAFTFWLVINKPTWITPTYRKLFEERIGVNDLQQLKAISKRNFFEIFMSTSRFPVIARGNIPLD